MNTSLVIIGRTRNDRENLTSTFLAGCAEHRIQYARLDGAPFGPSSIIGKEPVVVFASSNQRFQAVYESCSELGLPLIVASTGIDIPCMPMTPIVKAPNLAVLILALFAGLKHFGKLSQLLHARSIVAEGHQSSKKTMPGTAKTFAEMFGVPIHAIGSVRNDEVAEAILNVPGGELAAFGKHYIVVKAHGVKVRIETEVLGRQAYFLGLLAILEKMENLPTGLPSGVINAEDLLFPPDPFQQELLQANQAATDELKKLRSELQSLLPARK